MATITKEKVSTAEVGKLLATPENHFNDLKAKEIKPATLSRTLAAFANAEGGELFVGISESQDRKTRTWQSEIIESVRIRTGEGLISVAYPLEAIHEIVTNAVLHRDYSIADDIHIKIFDNRVEVLSPGVSPIHPEGQSN